MRLGAAKNGKLTPSVLAASHGGSPKRFHFLNAEWFGTILAVTETRNGGSGRSTVRPNSRGQQRSRYPALNRTGLLHRTQKMTNGPVGCARPLSPRHFVGGAEVDPLVDTDTDHITSRIGKAMIDLRCVGSRARHREDRSIPEEMLESTRHGPCKIIHARRIVRIWRRWKEREPVRITDCLRIAIVVPFLNRSNWPPEIPIPFGAPSSDERIG